MFRMILYRSGCGRRSAKRPTSGVMKLATRPAREAGSQRAPGRQCRAETGGPRRRVPSDASGRKAAVFYPGGARLRLRGGGRAPAPARRASNVYWPPLRATRGIRRSAWILVAAGVAAPAVRRRRGCPGRGAGRGLGAPVAAVRRHPAHAGRATSACAAQMWAYFAVYEMPNDDPERAARAGAGRLPGRGRPRAGAGSAADAAPAAAVRAPGHVRGSSGRWSGATGCGSSSPTAPSPTSCSPPRALPARGGADVRRVRPGAVFYWAIPTAPPWWAPPRGAWTTASARACGA